MQQWRRLMPEVFILGLLIHIAYFSTWNAGFVTDFTGLQWRLEGAAWHEFLHCFGFPALQQFLHLILYVFYNAFKANGLPWYLLFTTLHIANTVLLKQLIGSVAGRLNLSSPEWAAWAAALLFALSPYQTEVLVWRVCLNFLLSGFFVLTSLLFALRWFDSGERRHWWGAQLVLVAALFTFELGLVIPALSTLLLWLLPGEKGSFFKRFGALAGVQWAVVGMYFLLNKMVLGAWVGHYGEAVHLRFVPAELAANFWRYTAKLALFGRYLGLPEKQAVFGVLDKPVWFWSLSVLLAGALVASWLLRDRLSARLRLTVFFFTAFGLALAPIINLYFNNLMRIDGDRYVYLASMFFWAFAATALFSLPRKWAVVISASILLISVRLLFKTNQRWVESTRIYYALLDNYRWQNEPHVFLLNLPDNYQGAPMFRDHSMKNRALADPLYYLAKKKPAGQVYEVAQYNLASPNDGVQVQQDTAGLLSVQFLQTGNWWWRGGIGALPYEKQGYRFEPGDGKYTLHLDSIPAGSVFLIQKGSSWEEVDVLLK
ncbi:MAG TPA: hypothetical protein PLZ12_02785 [Saprospiraceae bacterium]|nr:hypothetical protein [Saprospiraceae bacterium]